MRILEFAEGWQIKPPLGRDIDVFEEQFAGKARPLAAVFDARDEHWATYPDSQGLILFTPGQPIPAHVTPGIALVATVKAAGHHLADRSIAELLEEPDEEPRLVAIEGFRVPGPAEIVTLLGDEQLIGRTEDDQLEATLGIGFIALGGELDNPRVGYLDPVSGMGVQTMVIYEQLHQAQSAHEIVRSPFL
jgi:hypothetical protein